MAIEIIPKKPERVFPWKDILFYFSIILLIVTAVSYFIIASLEKKTEATLLELEQKIAAIPVSELEKNILAREGKINDFGQIVDSHVFTTRVFELIQSKTHPKVYFSQISLSSKDLALNLTGETEDFVSLGQQMIVLEEETASDSAKIKSVGLSSVGINKSGKVGFSLQIALSPLLLAF